MIFCKCYIIKNIMAYQVKILLDCYGFLYVCYNPSCVHIGKFHLHFNAWLIIKQFKTEFRFEPYLDLLPLKFRNALSKLRLSSHNVAIETRRYSTIKQTKKE
jgi:hypothetical protein